VDLGAYGNTRQNSLTASTLIAVSGDGQTATEGTSLPQPLTVRVNYQTTGLAAEGVPLMCSVVTGGGSCPSSLVTNALGEVAFTPVLGTAGGQLFRIQASEAPFLANVDFTATATAAASGPVTSPGNPGDPVGDAFLNYRVGCSCGSVNGPDALLWLLLFGAVSRRRGAARVVSRV